MEPTSNPNDVYDSFDERDQEPCCAMPPEEDDRDVPYNDEDAYEGAAPSEDACASDDSNDEDNELACKNKEIGRRGEEAAVRFLERRGYDILERNWTCRFGEADIIAQCDDAIVFVEVKTRTSLEKGFPSEAVTPEKRSRYERIAACYLQNCSIVDVPVRFDVVALLVVGPDRALVKHHINAFGAE